MVMKQYFEEISEAIADCETLGTAPEKFEAVRRGMAVLAAWCHALEGDRSEKGEMKQLLKEADTLFTELPVSALSYQVRRSWLKRTRELIGDE